MGGDSETAEALVARGVAAHLERRRAEWAAGAPRAGWKIALNDPAVQRRLGLDAPLVAALDGRAVLPSGGSYAAEREAVLMAEAEVAVRLGRDLPPDAPAAEALASIAAVAPAIEIVDYARPGRGLVEILEHGVFHAAAVLGAAVPPPVGLTLATGLPVLLRNGEPAAAPDPALDPGDLALLVRAAATFVARHGERLRAGDWIITGSRVQPAPIAAGDEVTAEFGALGEARVSIVAPPP